MQSAGEPTSRPPADRAAFSASNSETEAPLGAEAETNLQSPAALKVLLATVAAVALLGFAWWLQSYSFLLFHGIAETFCVVIAAVAFIVAWNTRRYHGSTWIVLLGTTLLSVGVLDLFHLFAYRGMNAFRYDTTNAATELWIASRYLLSLSLLAAGLLVGRHRYLTSAVSPNQKRTPRKGATSTILLGGYGGVTALLLMSVFWWDIFPDCFHENSGLTPFKMVSEYVIALILIAGGFVFWSKRRQLDPHLLRLLLESIFLGVLAGLCFTLYQNVYGAFNWTGHLLKVASYGLLYGAIVVTAMQRPYALLFRDLKERETDLVKAKTDAEFANQAKDQFLAVLSHELRNPLNPVLAQVSALQRREDLPRDVLDKMTVIRRNVELEARLIDDLLDLTRITQGRLELIRKPTDVHELIRHALDICRDDAAQRQLKLDVQLDAQMHVVNADAARLLQVFWNVLKNAVKFSLPGGTVTIHTESIGHDGAATFRLHVTDTGIGIEADHIDHIFDAFRQSDDAVRRRFGGLGLGLSISRTLVGLHNGAIRAESDGCNKGARFVVELPVSHQQPVVEVEREPPVARQVSAQPDPSPLRLLLVEDHVDTARVMKQLLRTLGHQVRVAHTVADGLAAAEEEPFDLVVSDLGLPDGSGLELMQQLRERHRLIGICLSGYGMEEDVQRSREAGFSRHLVKPISVEALHDALNELARAPERSRTHVVSPA